MGRSAFVDDEALEDSDASDLRDELSKLLGDQDRQFRDSVSESQTDPDDNGSDLQDFIVSDTEANKMDTPRDVYGSHRVEDELSAVCPRCHCRLGTPFPVRPKHRTGFSTAEDSVRRVASPISVHSSDSGTDVLCSPGGLLSPGEDDSPVDVLESPLEVADASQLRSIASSRRQNSVCRATMVYLKPPRFKRKSILDVASVAASPSLPSTTVGSPASQKELLAATLFPDETFSGDIAGMETPRGESSMDDEERSYMAAVGSDLRNTDVLESLRDCNVESEALLIPDMWGGEVEFFPYEEWQKAEDRGDSDEVQPYYVKGPRSAQGKKDLFVLVRDSVVDQMVPVRIGKDTHLIKVKVFNSKVSMIRARDISKNLAVAPSTRSHQRDIENQNSAAEPLKRKRREAWHSKKYRRLKSQLEGMRAPYLAAARHAGAAYQWRE